MTDLRDKYLIFTGRTKKKNTVLKACM